MAPWMAKAPIDTSSLTIPNWQFSSTLARGRMDYRKAMEVQVQQEQLLRRSILKRPA